MSTEEQGGIGMGQRGLLGTGLVGIDVSFG